VRDLAERGVLSGDRGAYTCRAEVGDVTVPATLQATIAARIDRLDPGAKRALCAAAVIGSRFGTDLLALLGIDVVPRGLLDAELIDQVKFSSREEYAFHHPLIRAVAYESQLKSDRAGLHRRLAAAVERREPGSIDENAALIAEHLEAAGDLREAYVWHLRAGEWATIRDKAAACLSWERARQRRAVLAQTRRTCAPPVSATVADVVATSRCPATASSRQSLRTCWCRRCRPTLAGSHRAGRVPAKYRKNCETPGLASVSSIKASRRRYRALVEWPLRRMMSESRPDAPGISFVDDLGLDGPRRQNQGSPDPRALSQPEIFPPTPEIGVNGRRGL
jgi:hypothetical protein